MLKVTETLSATEQSICNLSVVSSTTLPLIGTSIAAPTGIGIDLIKNVVVFVAALPPPEVSETNFTEAVTCAV
tara:strand:- start:266 stop:484 length:219 start_codon:yes stop_codon:yes gene_type:complete